MTRGTRTTFDRRAFLFALAAGLPVTAAVLAACAGPRRMTTAPTEPPVPLARQDAPATLPTFPDLQPIAPDLAPERDATLRLFTWWPSYVSPKLVAAFEERYACRVKSTTFRTIDESVAQLRSGSVQADLYFPTLKVLGSIAAAELIQPLQHTYLPNRANIWTSMQDPFYDVGARYTVPYFNWTTGIAWREDLLPGGPRERENPYDLFWDPKLRGRVHVLDSNQDLISMAMLRAGYTDINSDSADALDAATDALLDLVDAVAPKIDSADFRDLYPGATWLHQSWSGNLSFAKHYAHPPSAVRDLRYLWPPELGTGVPGTVGSDVGVVLAGAANPVLAHLFLDFILDPEWSYVNSVYNGYQAPNVGVTRERLVAEGAVPPNLQNIITTEKDFDLGYQQLQLAPSTDAAWDAAYGEVVEAAKRARET